MKNILWYVYEKYSLVYPWQIFYYMSITILWKVLNLPTPSNIPQVLRSHWAKSFILSPAMAPSAKKRENIVLQFWIVSSILVLYWINYVWPKLYLREQKPSSAERNHFFWGFADSWVSSESEQCISLLQKHLKSFCFWSISISAARELGMTNHPQIQFLHDFLIHILFFPFKACLILCYPTPRSCHKTKLFKSPLTSIDWGF